MLINQSELQTMCLKESAVQDLAAQVINQLNAVTDPLIRYATANALRRVFEEACANTGQAAEAFCEKHDIGNDGKHFNYEGLCFNRSFYFNYNYAGNDTYLDENGDARSCGYRRAKADLEEVNVRMARVNKDYADAKAALDRAKAKVLREHPNMVPEIVRVTFNFNGDAEQKAVNVSVPES